MRPSSDSSMHRQLPSIATSSNCLSDKFGSKKTRCATRVIDTSPSSCRRSGPTLSLSHRVCYSHKVDSLVDNHSRIASKHAQAPQSGHRLWVAPHNLNHRLLPSVLPLVTDSTSSKLSTLVHATTASCWRRFDVTVWDHVSHAKISSTFHCVHTVSMNKASAIVVGILTSVDPSATMRSIALFLSKLSL